MTPSISELWVYLAASPLLGLTFTLLAYQGALLINKRCNANPGTPYRTYFEGAQFVHFLLGPATVALAIPLYAQLGRLKLMAVPLLVALLAGSITAACSAVLIGLLLGASEATLFSLAPKSVTTPIAMGIAERLGGLPSLTAVLVILTGILGAVGAQGLYAVLRIKDPAIRGFALGTASHGIGTARAFQVSEQTGAFSALAMGLNGLVTALLLPGLVPPLLRWLG